MDTLKEISHFYEQIVQYETLVKEWENTTSKDIENEMQNSRTELQRCYPKLEKKISHYSEYKPSGYFVGKKLDVFDVAFDSINKSNVVGKLNAINEIKNILNRAIGKLESEGESWGSLSTIKSKKTKSPTHKGKKSKYQKTWQWIKSHKIQRVLYPIILVVIALLGTNWDTVSDNFVKILDFFR